MKTSLVDHLKLLKSNKKAQNPKNKQVQVVSEVPIYLCNQGIFRKLSFCFMMKDEEVEKEESVEKQFEQPQTNRYHKLTELICNQGGQVVQLQNNKLIQVTYLLVDGHLDIDTIKNKAQGKVTYEQILYWKYPFECLKKFRILDTREYQFNSNSFNKIRIRKNKTQQHEEYEKIFEKSNLESKKSKQIPAKNQQNKEDSQYDQLIQPSKKVKVNQVITNNQQNNKLKQCTLGQIGTRPKGVVFQGNQAICDDLMELQRIYANDGDPRNVAYIRAVSIIKKYPKAIRCDQDVDRIKGLGRRIQSKIKQLLMTGRIEKLKRLQRNQNKITTLQLSKVWGIGSKKAQELYHKGIKTVQQLSQRPQLLTKNQRVGLKYHEQFQKRIPYAKVQRMFAIVKKALFETVRSQTAHKIEVTGSFRRGKSTCGDMDVIITRIDGLVEKKILHNLILKLEGQKFITDHLSVPRYFQGHTSIAYMGVCYFQEMHHRVDFKCYPVEQYAFALLYFTGSDLFNREMRMVAHNKGLLLSDHGIRKKQKNGVENLWQGGEIPFCYRQEDIFKFLELKYKSPEQRSI